MLMVKDLIEDLEKGNRVEEHLSNSTRKTIDLSSFPFWQGNLLSQQLEQGLASQNSNILRQQTMAIPIGYIYGGSSTIYSVKRGDKNVSGSSTI